ncbi:hypothetical protein M409DRAFT_21146 [Zasmidium cellare ATCC 36951]|uniref:Uncharacterized protein n=1 Tax=Zasmidium cellare ATCC 36951 TaxID=1080233 RepID=A0A6A6CML1_ZASCE|nr:uncharacterized protein M409DRAFT_21146 [Zasmidium cellare ATCC 36951]KAF2168395.1 hypothetical protein M409DRAFT_21146 [Zasmidium cellare ATCC 36951]
MSPDFQRALEWIAGFGSNRKETRHGNTAQRHPHSSRRDTYAEECLDAFCSSLPTPEDDRQARDYGRMKQWVSEFIHNTLVPFRREISELQSEHLQTIKRLEDERDKASRKFQQTIEEERTKSQRLAAKHATELQSIGRKHSEELATQQRRFERDIDDITAKHTAETQGLKRDYDVTRTRLEKEVQSLKNSLVVLETTAEEEKQNLAAMHDAALGSLRTQFVNDKNQLEREYQDREGRLASQIEELNAALLTRDDEIYTAKILTISAIPQKSDEKLRGSFSEIVKAVDDLSRLAWRHDQRAFSEADLARLRGQSSDRLLRKAILQDLVWSCLYDFLFASPFRMLGEEGLQLEKEWANQGGQGAPSDHMPASPGHP